MNEHELMMTAVLNCRRLDVYLKRPGLSADQQGRLKAMIDRRSRGVPLQYVLGDTDFMGFKIKVDERVFIPRPETELLVEALAARLESYRPVRRQAWRILDLGTGSGSIAVCAASLYPTAHVTAVDVCARALDVARGNAAAYGLQGRVSFVCADMENVLSEALRRKDQFDVIVSNPPYIPADQIPRLPAEVRREPEQALNGGDDGLKILRLILEKAGPCLYPGGILAVEIGDGQAPAVGELLERQQGFEYRFFRDYTGVLRGVTAVKLRQSPEGPGKTG